MLSYKKIVYNKRKRKLKIKKERKDNKNGKNLRSKKHRKILWNQNQLKQSNR